MMRRQAVLVIALALLLVRPVDAAKTTGVVLGTEWRTTGYESGLVLSRTPADCFLTDDWDLRIYSGSLAAGQAFEATFVFCARADVVLPDGVEVNDNHESLMANASGRGELRLDVIAAKGTFGTEQPASGSLDAWLGCALFSDRRQDAFGWWYGPVTVRLTNVGSRTARDITLVTTVSLDASSMREQCGR